MAAVPIGMLLSYGASLPFMLGLFFFTLFGLVVGAVMYRVALPARPFGRPLLATGAAAVVLVCWVISMSREAHDFPSDKANEALQKIAHLPEGMTAAQAKADIAEFVRRTLRENYGGDGMVGYARWVLASSLMEYRVETMKRPIPLRPAQHRWWWGMRVALSIVLLGFGVYSQVAPLAKVAHPGPSRPTSETDER